jgi:hypothetical protein
MTQKNQKNCKESGCTLKGFWVEKSDSGEPLFCFRTRHNGENHAVKLTVEEIQGKLEEAAVT